jgi:hypothetical protein
MSDTEIVQEFLVESYENLDRHLPRSAMVAPVAHFLPDDDDGANGRHGKLSRYAAAFSGSAVAPSAPRLLM